MLKLSEQQREQLRQAVAAAQGKAGLVEELETVYRNFQSQLDQRRPRCDVSGRCCRFEDYGHRLFVTTIELAAFAMSQQAAINRGTDTVGACVVVAGVVAAGSWDGTGCPYQLAGRCSVHFDRPFGCRVYFCDPTSTGWQEQQYESVHAQVKRLHEALEVPYFYVEWREALRAVGLATGDGSAAGGAGPAGSSPPRVSLPVVRL